MLFIHFNFEGIRTVGILIKNTKDYSPGDVFYYKSKKKTYGGVFLYRQQEYYLIALSEEILKPIRTICVTDILELALFTLAWFSDVDLLLPKRLHIIDTIPLAEDFSNRAGLLIDEQGVYLKNVGQSATWKHEFCSYVLRDTKVEDVLTNRFVPKTWR